MPGAWRLPQSCRPPCACAGPGAASRACAAAPSSSRCRARRDIPQQGVLCYKAVTSSSVLKCIRDGMHLACKHRYTQATTLYHEFLHRLPAAEQLRDCIHAGSLAGGAREARSRQAGGCDGTAAACCAGAAHTPSQDPVCQDCCCHAESPARLAAGSGKLRLMFGSHSPAYRRATHISPDLKSQPTVVGSQTSVIMSQHWRPMDAGNGVSG